MGVETILETHLKDCENTMDALFLSGFTVANDTVLHDITDKADKSRQLGLIRLAQQLEMLKGGMDELRHSVNYSDDKQQELMELYCRINQYIALGIKKCRYDMVREGLKERIQEEM